MMGALEMDARFDARARSLSPKLLAAASLLFGGAVLFVLGLVAGRPITFPDEVIYSGAARSLSAGRGFEVAGAPASIWTYGPLYVVFLAPIYRLAPSLHAAYLIARGFNVLLYTSAGIPIFLIARRVVSRRAAAFVAAAGVALPASIYTTKLQTESVAYPAAMWVALAAISAIALPTRRRQLVLLTLIACASLVRFQLIALALGVVTACLVCTPGSLATRIRRLSVLVGAVTAIGTLGVAMALASASRSAPEVHGLSLRHLTIEAVGRQFAGSLAALDLSTGVVPLAVVAVASLDTFLPRRSTWGDANARAVATVAMAFALSLGLVGSAYLAGVPSAWRPSPPTDRYTFYAVPLALAVFARWIEDGAPVGRRLRLAAWCLAVLPLVVAAAEVHGPRFTATGSALSFMPWMFLRALTPDLTWLILLAGYCVACAYMSTRPKVVRRSVVKIVAGSVSICTIAAFAYIALGSWNAERHSPPAGWLDARTNGPVVGVWVTQPTERQAFALWEVQMMNQNLSRVYYVGRPDRLGPESKLERRSDGSLLDGGRPVVARFGLTSSTTPIVGKLVSRRNGLALYELREPLRVATGE